MHLLAVIVSSNVIANDDGSSLIIASNLFNAQNKNNNRNMQPTTPFIKFRIFYHREVDPLPGKMSSAI